MTDDHDDLHDRGLAFDLQTLLARRAEPRRLERRGALKLLAGAGAGLVLVACGSDDATSADATTTSTVGGSTTSTAAGSGSGSGQAVGETPEETGGPYPGDGSNGPNVLTERGIVRSDITSSYGDYTGTAGGVPNTIRMTIVEAATGAPMAGAAVYVWHCSREAGYSLYSQGVTDQNYLRGVQAAGTDGTVTFRSIFPAAYDGRWPHIHFEVFDSLATATRAGSKLLTSQIALPEGACRAVYATSGYEQSVTNLARTSLDTDMVFRDGYDLELGTCTGDTSAMTTALTVAI